MPKWKRRKNTILRSLLLGFAGINEMIAGMLAAGKKEFFVWALRCF